MAMPTSYKVFWTLSALGGLWAVFLSALTNPVLQRHALYAHKAHTAWWQDLDRPEQWGYLKNQIRPFNVTTQDGVTLYAWHILPLDEYRQHETALLEETPGTAYKSSVAFKALRDQPKSKVVVNFHGNAGHIGQGWRTDGYRALAASHPHLHVIAFDYRGFGYSSGSPTETGLIVDGVAVVDWIFGELEMAPSSVALVGQSLGTAVATAVIEHYAAVRGVDLAGLVLIAPFSDLRTLLMTYSIGWFIPIFSPLNPYPKLQNYFKSKVIDTWETDKRLATYISASKNANVMLIHAKDDYDIHWTHSNTLFDAAANATSDEGLTSRQISVARMRRDLGAQGQEFRWVTASKQGGTRRITQLLMDHGGHNRIVSYPVVSKAVLDIFS